MGIFDACLCTCSNLSMYIIMTNKQKDWRPSAYIHSCPDTKENSMFSL